MGKRRLDDEELERVSGGTEATDLERTADSPEETLTRRRSGDTVRLPSDGRDKIAPVE